MKTVDKIKSVMDSKEQIRQAIIYRGVNVPPSKPFRDYCESIKEIGQKAEGNVGIHYIKLSEITQKPQQEIENSIANRIDYIEFYEAFKNPDLSYLLAGMYRLRAARFNGSYAPTSLSHIFWNTGVGQDTFDSLISCITDVSHLQNIDNIGIYGTSFNIDPKIFNGAPLVKVDECFSRNTFTTLDLSGWDLSHIVSAKRMFAGCKATEIKGIQHWSSNLKNADYMFTGCQLTSLDLSKWNIPNLESDIRMFQSCKKLKYLDFSGIHISKDYNIMTAYLPERGQLLCGCSSLETVIWPNDFIGYMENSPADGSFELVLNDCPLNHDTVLNLFNVVPHVSGSRGWKKIILSPSSKALMSADEINIARKKGWTIS